MPIELDNYIEETLATTITEITGSPPEETKPIIFRNEASLTWWLTKKHGIEVEKVEAMTIAAKPYIENCKGVQIRETYNSLGKILLCFHGAEGDFRDTSLTVINPENFGKGPMLDVPHFGLTA